jgi:predicted enzyme related to lactoylglutathione lyase
MDAEPSGGDVMGRPVVHFEIGVADADRSRDFYGELFGWTIRLDGSGYGLVDTGAGAGINGGILQAPEGVPAYVTLYVGVDDLDRFLERAEELGGKTVTEPMAVGDMGSFAMFADPDGNMIGLFKEVSPS